MLTLRKRALVVLALVAGLVPSAGVVQAERADAPPASSARAGATKFVAGGYFTCSLSDNGTIRCWGDNTYGQLGNGLTNSQGETSSVAVLGISDAVQLTAGSYHACALLSDGRVKCWGYGLYGQLGYGSKGVGSNRATPVFVRNSAGTADLTGVSSVAAGYDHTCAILAADSSVLCWGQSSSGALGSGEISGGESQWQPLPVVVRNTDLSPLSGVTELALGLRSSCALLTTGEGRCWGSNATGQAGIGDNSAPKVNVAYATAVVGVSGATALTSGSYHSCFVASASLSCAGGLNDAYIFGAAMPQVTPMAISESNAKQVVGSDRATCILRATATVVCAGGIYTFENSQTAHVNGSAGGPTSTFTEIAGLTGVVSLAAGSEHFCAMTASSIKCWGRNNYGQLGNGDRNGTNVSGLVDVVGIEAPTVTISDPGLKTVGSGSFDVTASASSGAAVTLSIDPSSTAVCTIAGLRITILDAGTCLVIGLAPPSGIYSAGSGSRTLTISALAPTLSSGSAASISVNGATLTTSINPHGASSSISVEYGVSASLVGATTAQISSPVSGNANTSVTKDVSGLAPGTTYYFRFVATNTIGSTLGEIGTFGTAGARPTATNGAATPETFTATLSADVNANEVETTVAFDYGTDPTLAKSDSVSVATAVTGTTLKAVSVAVTKLNPATTYYYRVVATNAVGTARGDIKSFTTKGSKPTAVTGSATRATAGMTVNGKVNPKDLETTVRFEYGTDPKLVGAQQTAAKSQTGAEDVDVTAVLTELSENTTYYYRVTATNIVGATDGDIKSFTTTRPEGVSINDGDEFTSSESVIVSVVGPSTAVKAILSNDGGFKTTETFDLTNNSADIPWKLQSSREGTFTKIVYVKYVSRFGSQSQAVTDDIILDRTKPVMTTATAVAAAPTGSAVTVSRISAKAKPKASGGVRLSLRGSDTISGIGTIEVRSAANKPATKVNVSRVAGKADGKPRAASQTVTLRTTAKRLQVRVIDRAGNASAWRTITVR